MIRLVSMAILTAYVLCSPFMAFGQQIELQLSISAEVQTDKRVVLVGKTNLPDGTQLMLSIEEGFTGETKGQSKTKVRSGAFRSEPFGKPTGYPAGRYVAGVTMPYTRIQSEEVKKTLGTSGEKLIGDIIERDATMRATASLESEFFVGDRVAATKLQFDKLSKDIESYKAFAAETEALYRELKRNARFIKDKNNLDALEKWGVFARSFREKAADLGKRIQKIESLSARVSVGLPVGDLQNLFHSTAFNKSDEIPKDRKTYLKSAGERNDFLKELAEQLNQNSNEKPKFRTWTSTTGKHKTEAEFVSLAKGLVTLRKKDGKEVTLSVDRLSDVDRDYVNRITK